MLLPFVSNFQWLNQLPTTFQIYTIIALLQQQDILLPSAKLVVKSLGNTYVYHSVI